MKRAGVALILLGLLCVLQFGLVEAVHPRPQPELLSLAVSLMSVPFIAGGLGLLNVERLRRRLSQPPPTTRELARQHRKTAILSLLLAGWNLLVLVPRHSDHVRWGDLLIGLFWLFFAVTSDLRS